MLVYFLLAMIGAKLKIGALYWVVFAMAVLIKVDIDIWNSYKKNKKEEKESG